MNNPVTNNLDRGGLYPIRTVSDLTGVNAITLRAWERRYSLFEPVRKESGHRLYTREHIDLITRVVGLLDRGMRIGQVKAHLESDQSNEATGDQLNGSWGRYLDQMLAAVIQFDETSLELTYGEALALYPVDQVTENLLTPLLAELGRRWAEDQGSVAEEHFFGFYLRNKLGARFHHRNVSSHGPRLLLACLPGDRHETGLLLFALAANNAGFHTILLGADMPLEDLPAAARKTGSKAIILSGLIKPGSNTVKKGLPQLALESDIPVFVGGRASVAVHDQLKRAGIQALGTDIKTALARVNDAIGETNQESS